MISYVWHGRRSGRKLLNGLAIIAHVCMVDVAQQPNDSRPSRQKSLSQLEFNVLGPRPSEFPFIVDSVGHPRHQNLGVAHSPRAILILNNDSYGVAARIGCVIVSTVVINSPIQKLQMAVASRRIEIEEIGHTEFAYANL